MGKRQMPPAEDRAGRRTFVSLPLAQLLPPIILPAYRHRSPAGATLMADWATIVGPRLAALTQPRKLSRGQLTVACEGPVAMELQHASATLIERINVQTGRGLVERLRFVQAPVSPAPPRAAMEPVEVEPLEEMPPGALNQSLAALRARLRKKTGSDFAEVPLPHPREKGPRGCGRW